MIVMCSFVFSILTFLPPRGDGGGGDIIDWYVTVWSTSFDCMVWFWSCKRFKQAQLASFWTVSNWVVVCYFFFFCSCLPGKLPQPSAAVAGPQGRTCQWGCQATGAEASGLDISWPGRWRPLQGHCQELQRKYSEFLCAVPYVCPKVMPRKYNEVLFCIICFAVRSACPWLCLLYTSDAADES